MIRPLHYLGSPALRRVSDPVSEVTSEVRELVEDLFETMRANEGVGLAANQVGESVRVAVVDIGDDDPVVLINPEITHRDGTDVGEEGCLSIPEIFGDVKRALSIGFTTTTLDGNRIELEATELKARAIQHEIDHLDGILFIDHLSPLKKKMLIKKWQKLRKGKGGYIQEAVPASAGEE